MFSLIPWAALFWWSAAASALFALYLIARTVVINDGERGLSFNAGKLEILKPGVNILVNPMHQFKERFSIIDQVVELPEIEILTTDKIPMNIQAVLTYQINEKSLGAVSPDNFKASDHLHSAIIMLAKSTLASIVSRYSLEEISPSPNKDNQVPQNMKFVNSPQMDIRQSVHDEFIQKLSQSCAGWGVTIKDLTVENVHPIDKTLTKEMGEAQAVANARAAAKLRNAEAESVAVQRKAFGYAQGMRIVANAEQECANTLGIRSTGELVKLWQTQGIAQASKTTTMLPTGNNGVPLVASINSM